MGYRTVVLEPDPGSPAGAVADVHLSPRTTTRLRSNGCADVRGRHRRVREPLRRPRCERLAARTSGPPVGGGGRRSPRTGIAEKPFLADAGFPVGAVRGDRDRRRRRPRRWADFPGDPQDGAPRLRRQGAGRASPSADELAAAWAASAACRACSRHALALDAELSVIVARTATGDDRRLPGGLNRHDDGILDVTVVPAPCRPDARAEAPSSPGRIAEALDYVGVLAVEFFVVDGGLLVNEIAPRPHNSGHWTIDAAVTSQFEQQVRAVCGLAAGRHRR